MYKIYTRVHVTSRQGGRSDERNRPKIYFYAHGTARSLVRVWFITVFYVLPSAVRYRYWSIV